ncbi:MAG: hypothetical protein JXR76_15505, partial [Deltaproteobacteria bacterium]|nr:hypothetical protein [Deltaproteobacteria bacterium]
MSSDTINDKFDSVRPAGFASQKRLTQEDENVRRIYAMTGIIAGIGLQLFFSVSNFFMNMKFEAGFDLSSAVILGGALMLLTFCRHIKWGYRLGVFAMVYINTYTSAFPVHEISAVIQGFYCIPVVMFYLLGFREGWVWSGVVYMLLLGVFYHPLGDSRSVPEFEFIVDTIASYSLITVFSAFLERFRAQSFNDVIRSSDAMRTAVAEQDTLGGLVPLCSYCNKVRNDGGFWQNLEGYLQSHTHAHISSGICDKCAEANPTLKETAEFAIPGDLETQFIWRKTEEVNKQRYIKWIIIAGISVLWAFIVRDLFWGNRMEPVLEFGLSVVLLVIVLQLDKAKRLNTAYQLATAAAFVIFNVQFFTPSPDASDHLWLFSFPLVAMFAAGYRIGVIWSAMTCAMFVAVLTVPWFQQRYSPAAETGFFFVTTYLLVSVFSFIMERFRERYFERVRSQMTELEKVYDGIRTLKGLIPVCRVCKSIRNDKGYWTRVDHYLYSHTHLNLSHGICPDCLKKEMPELYEEMKTLGDF